MPHKRSKKNINGAPCIKLPKDHSILVGDDSLRYQDVNVVPASSFPIALADASLFGGVSVQAHMAPDGDAPMLLSAASDASLLGGVSDNTTDCSFGSNPINADDFTSPDMNPFFDVIDELESAMSHIAFRTADDFSKFVPGICKHSPAARSSSIPLCQEPLSNDLSTVCSLDLDRDYHLLECCQVLASLKRFTDAFRVFENVFYAELAETSESCEICGWDVPFFTSCLLEYQCLFEHFSSSSRPRLILLHFV